MGKPTTPQEVAQGKPLTNPKHELFCQLYVSKDFFGNGTEAYAEAYDKDLDVAGAYNVCACLASRLLKNVNILDRINQIMEHCVLNNQFVDREMGFVISQKADLHAKMKAINEYNKLRKRINDGIVKVEGLSELIKMAKSATEQSSASVHDTDGDSE